MQMSLYVHEIVVAGLAGRALVAGTVVFGYDPILTVGVNGVSNG